MTYEVYPLPVLATDLEPRIRELLVVRSWYRRYRWADWPVRRSEVEIELRALLPIARAARRRERGYAAMGYHGWQAIGPA